MCVQQTSFQISWRNGRRHETPTDGDTKRRLAWVAMYQATGNAGLTCLRCGISRPTLRKWSRLFDQHGETGLISRSTRPRRSPRRKIDDAILARILELRRVSNIGARRIQIELGFSAEIWLSRTIIQRAL